MWSSAMCSNCCLWCEWTLLILCIYFTTCFLKLSFLPVLCVRVLVWHKDSWLSTCISTWATNKDNLTSSFSIFMPSVYFSCLNNGWIPRTRCWRVMDMEGALVLLQTWAEKPHVLLCSLRCWFSSWGLCCKCTYIFYHVGIDSSFPSIPILLSVFRMNRCWIAYLFCIPEMLVLFFSSALRVWWTVFPNVKSRLHFQNELHLD